MRLITERTMVQAAPALFAKQYGHYSTIAEAPWRNDGKTIGEIIDQLNALDTSTSTAADVDAIIGAPSTSWGLPYCNECSQHKAPAVSFPDAADYGGVVICIDCINDAYDMIQGAK